MGGKARISLRSPQNRRRYTPFRFASEGGQSHSEETRMANKNDLIGMVADKAALTKAQAGEAVDAVFDAIAASLTKGEEVRLVGFGTFAVSKRKASIGRNPATGAEIKIPASNQAKFKPGKGLKDAIN